MTVRPSFNTTNVLIAQVLRVHAAACWLRCRRLFRREHESVILHDPRGRIGSTSRAPLDSSLCGIRLMFAILFRTGIVDEARTGLGCFGLDESVSTPSLFR